MPRKSSTPIPEKPIERILSDAGAHRVAAAAAKRLAHDLSDAALRIAEAAVRITRHAGRKTVQARDIRLAYETTRQ